MAFYLLYVTTVAAAGPVKIGFTGNLHARVSALRSGNAKRLIVAWVHPFPDKITARAAEARAHAMLAHARLNGEWFDINPHVAAAVIKRELNLTDTLDVDIQP